MAQCKKGRSALVIVAKAPVAGRVKTRLTPPLSSGEAARLYLSFLKDIIAKSGTMRDAVKYIALDLSGYGGNVDSIRKTLDIPDSFNVVLQCKGGLGDRLICLSDQCFKEVERLLFIGADSPSLPFEYVEQAFNMLNDSNVVIGPSDDGGYYLIGLSGRFDLIFQGIDWSTHLVFEQTLSAAQRAGLKVGILPSWYDIDTHKDVRRLKEELERDPAAAPSTAEFLKTFVST